MSFKDRIDLDNTMKRVEELEVAYRNLLVELHRLNQQMKEKPKRGRPRKQPSDGRDGITLGH